jgi:guanylate kinase
VGKGTIAQRLIEADDHLWLSRSWTTRPRRASEKGGEYHFVEREAFEQAIDDNQFLEWAEFHGNLYGTPLPKAPNGAGAEQVRRDVPDAVVVLILPPSMRELEERLRSRGDKDDHVAMRLSSTPEELAKGQELASYVIVNDDIERATAEILSILEELRRLRRDPS